MNSNLLISFSGGETSAYMTWWMLNFAKDKFKNIEVVFANTGQEHENTLIFVDKCDKELGFNTVWIEAVQHHGQKKSACHRIVSYNEADRVGAVYEDMIKKYGIPNQKFPSCTRDLKLNPIKSYAKSLGWGDNYTTAIGIRSDEVDRISVNAKKHKIIYPLIQMNPMTKPQINKWWDTQSFRLNITGYQGNCVWCWKKTFRKHYTLIEENPEYYDFPRRMEKTYGEIGPEFKKQFVHGYKRTFFRGNKSVDDLFHDYEKIKNSFEKFHDENRVYDSSLDIGGGCGESCEVFSDEMLSDIN